jgi:S1-C subfamily serine protease
LSLTLPEVRGTPVLPAHCALFQPRYPSGSMQFLRNAVPGLLGAFIVGYWLGSPALADRRANVPVDDSALSSAICPIVYPLDQSPSERGFHYTFYGNGFFINNEGYLLTAAHVLSQLSDATPYVVLRLPMAPPRFLKAEVVAADREHDVALLRATPNPFLGKYQVRFLPLAVDRPTRMQSVLAAALRPSRLRDPHTFDAFVEDRPAGEVLEYEFSQLDRGRPETELILFSHEVLLGDSGAPVVSTDSQAVVGLVEGRWLRANAISLATAARQSDGGVGAAVPIHYAIPLLQQSGVSWHATEPDSAPTSPTTEIHSGSYAPVPLSLIAASFPAQALQGGEVVLDARVGRDGQLADIKVMEGSPPFVEKVLSAVRTWSFQPNGPPRHVGIVFQYASPGVQPGSPKVRRYELPRADANERAALPTLTKETEACTSSHADGSLILAAQIDKEGELMDTQVLQDTEALAPTVLQTVRTWKFIPGKQDGTNCASSLIIVIVPRQGARPQNPRTARIH